MESTHVTQSCFNNLIENPTFEKIIAKSVCWLKILLNCGFHFFDTIITIEKTEELVLVVCGTL